jgi:polyphosphate kinase 2
MKADKKKKGKDDNDSEAGDLKRKDYEEALDKLHGELVHLQEWVVREGAKVCVVFEGRDGAGKGGVIKAITDRVSPRIFRVAALPAPSDREKTQLYWQRYAVHLPSGGEIVIFDRSWYNRAGVERVMGFCSKAEAKKFLEAAPLIERAMVDSGIILLKYWLEVSAKEQTKRLEDRINDARKVWKLSPMDLKSYARWDDYTDARNDMFAATDTKYAPWWVANSDEKRRARLNVIAHMLSMIPYQKTRRKSVKLPKRKTKQGKAPRTFKYVPDEY